MAFHITSFMANDSSTVDNRDARISFNIIKGTGDPRHTLCHLFLKWKGTDFIETAMFLNIKTKPAPYSSMLVLT
ncbi:hypothetical protein OUZ56_025431 [Daphnia magna]|uniref:Uncharacterized protein n=1 Tax=Daphnia magna TaxID=35525 RepID=A0ABQ9ZJV6_9CRUS|nr:hypothetical protein OUZ56_025431 [Daphnia magna]